MGEDKEEAERGFDRAIAKANKELENSNVLMKEGKRLIEEMRTTQEVFNDRLEKLDKLLEAETIGLNVYARAVERAKEELNRAKVAADGLKSSLGITAAEIGSRELLAQGLALAQIDRETLPPIQGPQQETKEEIAAREKAERLFGGGPKTIGTADTMLENAKLFARMVAAQERLVEIEESKEDETPIELNTAGL